MYILYNIYIYIYIYIYIHTYIYIYLLVLKSTRFKECRVGKSSLLRANDLSLSNHGMLYKENMNSHKHLAFITLVSFTRYR